MDTAHHFKLNDRVRLAGDFLEHYYDGAICTVVDVERKTVIGVKSDTDPTDSPLYVWPFRLTHVTNVALLTDPPRSYGGGSTGTTGHSIDHFPHIKAAPAAPVQAEKADVVVRPAHYTRWVIEPITFIMRNGMEFWRGNIIKYIARAGEKQYDGLDKVQSEITDLRKAARYCEIRINQLQGKGDSEL